MLVVRVDAVAISLLCMNVRYFDEVCKEMIIDHTEADRVAEKYRIYIISFAITTSSATAATHHDSSAFYYSLILVFCGFRIHNAMAWIWQHSSLSLTFVQLIDFISYSLPFHSLFHVTLPSSSSSLPLLPLNWKCRCVARSLSLFLFSIVLIFSKQFPSLVMHAMLLA